MVKGNIYSVAIPKSASAKPLPNGRGSEGTGVPAGFRTHSKSLSQPRR